MSKSSTPATTGRSARHLPPGQQFLTGPMPRYGLPKYVRCWITPPQHLSLGVRGAVKYPLIVTESEMNALPNTGITRDFHCVTTWSTPDLHWQGWAFRDVWDTLLAPIAKAGVTHLNFRALDGYRVCIPLEELLKDDVLLATHLHGEPLTLKHGAPLRLVTPQLYGYKNLKHLHRIELLTHPQRNTFVGRLLIHPRGRVDLEERSSVGPQRLWRSLYKQMLPGFLKEAENWQEHV